MQFTEFKTITNLRYVTDYTAWELKVGLWSVSKKSIIPDYHKHLSLLSSGKKI